MAFSHPRGCPYAQYYVHQAQRGSGIGHFYAGAPHQKGYGLGSFLKGMFRSAIPLLQSPLRAAWGAVSKEALRAGANVLSNTLTQHKPLKEAVRDQWAASASSLAEKAKDSVQRMVGSGHRIRKRRAAPARQSTRSKRAKRTVRKKPVRRKKKKASPKRRRRTTTVKRARDIFDD